MSAGWVAGGVRSRAMTRRRLGTAGVRDLAGSASLAEAVDVLTRSPYGQLVHSGDSLAAAQRGVAATVLWNLRVLAGWLPAAGAEMLRLLTGWFEIANVDEHLAALAGRPSEPPYRLGALATAWTRLAAAGSPGELRTVLTASSWGDPGGATPRDIQLGMRLAWAERVAARVPAARAWAAGAVALLVARERFGRQQRLSERAHAMASTLLGPGWPAARSPAELAQVLPVPARWALEPATAPADLWTAEAQWWRRLRADAARLLAASGFGRQRPIGAVALLAADAWLVRGALVIAARGGTADPEVLDALA